MAKSKQASTSTKEPTRCPVSKAEFSEQAKPIVARIGDTQVILQPKEFSTGSYGFYCGEKVIVQVGDTPVKCQLAINMVLVGSKQNGQE